MSGWGSRVMVVVKLKDEWTVNGLDARRKWKWQKSRRRSVNLNFHFIKAPMVIHLPDAFLMFIFRDGRRRHRGPIRHQIPHHAQ